MPGAAAGAAQRRPLPAREGALRRRRYVRVQGRREAYANVGFTGEIQGISAGFAVQVDDEPIKMHDGYRSSARQRPAGRRADHETYRYWVAVTDRNREVIAKEYFDLP